MKKDQPGEQANNEMPSSPLPTHVKALFDFFLSRYEPAASALDVQKKTTAEIYAEMYAHCPSFSFTQESIYIFLTDHKFTYETPGGDLQFVWLLKYKQKQE